METPRRIRPSNATEYEDWQRQQAQEEGDDHVLLHQTVVTSKKQQLELQQERLAKQRAFIRHERRKLLLQNALLESERERFDASLSSDWFCLRAFPTAHDRRVTIDVGGQLFEISSVLAAKDPGSLLAALIEEESPIAVGECGCFRVERDWWLFRYVLRFLRDGLLPQEPKMLRELYLESEFWKLDSLRRAIEMKNKDLLQRQQEQAAQSARLVLAGSADAHSQQQQTGKGASLLSRLKSAGGDTKEPELKPKKPVDPSAWWMDAPVWWGRETTEAKEDTEKKPSSLLSAMKKLKGGGGGGENAKPEPAEESWWKSNAYKGTDFTQILSPPKKPADAREEQDVAAITPRAPLVLSSTWSSSMHLHD